MTLTEIEALGKNILTPSDVAAYLDMSQYTINLACKAGQLPWAYMVGTRCKIPKEAFVNWHRYGSAPIKEMEE
jgi:excisionase family DNA binding protein